MITWIRRYQFPLLIALSLHMGLVMLFMLDPSSHERPVLTKEVHNEPGAEAGAEKELSKQPEIVQAEAVDQQAVTEAVERLKQTRAQEQQKVIREQQALQREAQAAQAARIAEQKRLQSLQAEEERIAIAHKKAIEEEKQRLQALAEKKVQELKELEALKAKQQALKVEQEKIKRETEKKKIQADLEKKQAEAKNKLAAAKREAARKQAEQAAIDASKKARVAGEVNKYKAMILNAIGRQWILPETVRPGLSSQFRIRLGSDGSVLEVSLMHSSGDPILDRSAQTAIYKASPLPVPADADTFALFRDISLTVRPESVRG
jgi:colicin import membrane protein